MNPSPIFAFVRFMMIFFIGVAAARQSFDKLTTEISKLQAQGIPDAQPGSRRASQR